ncbi:MAG TPA: class I SAM-dependent methyltransferase [Polyangia bacterium]
MALLGLALPDTARLRLDAGAPELRLEELALERELEPGRPLRLIDRGAGVVASGVADPENGVVRVWSRQDVRGFDAAFFRRRVQSALAIRRAVGLLGEEESFRLINESGDGLPGLTADFYAGYAVICVPGKGLLTYGRLLAEAMLIPSSEGGPGCKGAVVKVRGKDPQDRSAKEEILGESPPAKLVTRELGVPYEVHLLGSLNVGLFTDMREHRRNLARFATGRRVLNTFAYTGALSVAAARAGATAVTSVDLSGGVLSWAKENFRLSNLDPNDAKYAFETSDTRRYFERAREANLTFDTIILDPPTVSAARASQWSMKKDYPDLIALATRLLPVGGGVLWVSGNPRRGPGVLTHAIEGIRRAGKRAALLELGGLPPDYPTPPDWAEARYLEVCLLHVSDD